MEPGSVRVVLVRPRIAGNVGAVARAMNNFGATDLVLVAPEADPRSPEARQRATRGEPILDAARTVDTLHAALADAHAAWATAGPHGGLFRKSTAGPREAMPLVAARVASGDRVALVFGPEATGLTDAEIAQCQGLVVIPTAGEHDSLNLSHAVAVCLYELHLAQRPGVPDDVPPATLEELGRSLDHLREALEAIHFLYGDKADALDHALRRLIVRARPSLQETKFLHGLARQILAFARRDR